MNLNRVLFASLVLLLVPLAWAAPNASFQKLQGKWLRPDGGYVIEVQDVQASGEMDAFYFNPRSIHVAKARATHKQGTLSILIELRDVNYPGSTYKLTYDPKTDQLTGTYYQALDKELYEVTFSRLKP